MKNLDGFSVTIESEMESVRFPRKGGLRLEKDSYCMLPFNLDMDGVPLKYES